MYKIKTYCPLPTAVVSCSWQYWACSCCPRGQCHRDLVTWGGGGGGPQGQCFQPQWLLLPAGPPGSITAPRESLPSHLPPCPSLPPPRTPRQPHQLHSASCHLLRGDAGPPHAWPGSASLVAQRVRAPQGGARGVRVCAPERGSRSACAPRGSRGVCAPERGSWGFMTCTGTASFARRSHCLMFLCCFQRL